MSKFLSIEEIAYQQQTEIDHVHIVRTLIDSSDINASKVMFNVPMDIALKTIEDDVDKITMHRYRLDTDNSTHHARYYRANLSGYDLIKYEIIENRFVIAQQPITKTPLQRPTKKDSIVGLYDVIAPEETDDEIEIDVD